MSMIILIKRLFGLHNSPKIPIHYSLLVTFLCLTLMACGDGTVSSNKTTAVSTQTSTVIPVDEDRLFSPISGTQISSSTAAAADKWAQNMIANLTIEQEISLLHTFDPSIFNFNGIGSAGSTLYVPHIKETCSGPGLACGAGAIGQTALPGTLALAASWDTDIAKDYGARVGKEMHAAGFGIGIGPGMTLAREPRWGRTYEMMGEDPILAGLIAANHVAGAQQQSVMEMPYFYGGDFSDYARFHLNSRIDERTLREIYLLPFEIVVKKSNPGGVMCSYALVNKIRECENKRINDFLRDDFGFTGFLQADCCAAVWDWTQAVWAGLDVDMGTTSQRNGIFDTTLLPSYQNGAVSKAQLDTMAYHVLYTFFIHNLIDGPLVYSGIDQVSGLADALRFSESSMVLLKNTASSGDGQPVLPISSSIPNIVVVGNQADKRTQQGYGSGSVSASALPVLPLSPLAALQRFLPTSIIKYYDFSLSDNADVKNDISKADMTIIFGTQSEGEGGTLSALNLDSDQDRRISNIADLSKRTVVVLQTGSPVTMHSWIGKVQAVLEAWYPGVNGGTAIANVLIGKINPSGKLPITFPANEVDLPESTVGPYVNLTADFQEKLNIGYRWFDAKHKTPLFPFGFGLSYTNFDYSQLQARSDSNGNVSLTFLVKNSGKRDGAEVAEVYVSIPESEEPPKKLVNFAKVFIRAGESSTVTIPVDSQRLKIWDTNKHHWVFPEGNYQFMLGGSSDNLPLRATLFLNEKVQDAKIPKIKVIRQPATTWAGVKQTYTISGENLNINEINITLNGLTCAPRGPVYPSTLTVWCQAPRALGNVQLTVTNRDTQLASATVNVIDTPNTPGGYLRVGPTGEPFAYFNNFNFWFTVPFANGVYTSFPDRCVLQTRDQSSKPLDNYLLWEHKRYNNPTSSQDWSKEFSNIINVGSIDTAVGYANAINTMYDENYQAGLCGSNQWSLPSVSQLQAIISTTPKSGKVYYDTDYFADNSPTCSIWWTSTPSAASDSAVSIDFINGKLVDTQRESKACVRLVSLQ